MKNQIFSFIGKAAILTGLLALSGGTVFAANNNPMTPEVAAKRENVRKQEEQRLTPEKRKAAAEALKAERLKVYQAKQAAKQSAPAATDTTIK